MEKPAATTLEHYSSSDADAERRKSEAAVVVQHVEASKATRREHDLSVRDAIRLYPKAIGFSLIFSTAIIMEGYDLSLLGSLYGYPASVYPYVSTSTIKLTSISVSKKNSVLNQDQAESAGSFLPTGKPKSQTPVLRVKLLVSSSMATCLKKLAIV